MQPDHRNVLVDVLRTLSIGVVLAIHLHISKVSVPPSTPILSHIWTVFFINGPYGVTLFFVISGFVITSTSAMRRSGLFGMDPRAFYVRRAARILPLLLLMIAIGIVLNPIATDGSARTTFAIGDAKANFDTTFWLSVFTFTFNVKRILSGPFGLHWDVLWSLSIEEQFYLGFPLVVLLLRRPRNMIIFLLVMIVIGPVWRTVAYLIAPRNLMLSFCFSLSCFDLLAMGCLAYFVGERLRPWLDRSKTAQMAFVGSGAVLLIGTYAMTSIADGFDRIYAPSLLGFGAFLILVAAPSIRAPILDTPAVKMLTYPGKLSYGIYLMHGLVLFAFWPAFSGLPEIPMFLMYCLVATAVASIVYNLFEKPMNLKIRARALQHAR